MSARITRNLRMKRAALAARIARNTALSLADFALPFLGQKRKAARCNTALSLADFALPFLGQKRKAAR